MGVQELKNEITLTPAEILKLYEGKTIIHGDFTIQPEPCLCGECRAARKKVAN